MTLRAFFDIVPLLDLGRTFNGRQTIVLRVGLNAGVTATSFWACHVGENIVEGQGGFGPTPLLALQDLALQIARCENIYTDNGCILLR